jgi:hypothetical protein
MRLHPEDPTTWPCCRPLIIAHDVARSNDHSTAMIGGPSPFQPPVVGVLQAGQMTQGSYGHTLAGELANIDRTFQSNGLILADVSRDDSYAEILYQYFGRRLIGLHITRFGDGSQGQYRQVQNGSMPVYTVGRTYLIDFLLSQFQANQVRLSQDAEVRRGFEQLTKLETEHRESGKIYSCVPGQHDDLGISLAMLVWAARHPHLPFWMRAFESRRRRSPGPKLSGSAGWT